MRSRIGACSVVAWIAVASCSQPCDGALSIDGLLLPDPPDCVARLDGALVTMPVLDVSAWRERTRGPTYVASMLVTNGAAACVGARFDTVGVTLRSIDGRRLDLPGFVNPYTVPADETYSTSGRAVVVAEIVPASAGLALASGLRTATEDIVAHLAVTGADGGGRFVSAERDVTIRLCAGCLRVCDASAPALSCWRGQDVVSHLCP